MHVCTCVHLYMSFPTHWPPCGSRPLPGETQLETLVCGSRGPWDTMPPFTLPPLHPLFVFFANLPATMPPHSSVYRVLCPPLWPVAPVPLGNALPSTLASKEASTPPSQPPPGVFQCLASDLTSTAWSPPSLSKNALHQEAGYSVLGYRAGPH